MARQHTTPLMLDPQGDGAVALVPLALTGSADGVSEAAIQALVQAHPSCLPITEIDPLFAGPVPICIELNTPAGSIDNFMVTPSGLPVLVECKLWRNPEGRREVVGQILDYAKELSRWTASDLQREVSRRLKREGNPLLDLVRDAGHDVDEIAFNDALTLNLRRGRFLLLIVGDGIREGVEAIAEYLQAHAGLHFTLGLVEMPTYATSDGGTLVVPRVLARTHLITREVVAIPEGFALQEEIDVSAPEQQLDEWTTERLRFMHELLGGLQLSDPEQPKPKTTPKGYLFLYMPAPKSSCWINVSVRQADVGVWLVSNKNTIGDRALSRLAEDWPNLRAALGGMAEHHPYQADRSWFADTLDVSPFRGTEERQIALKWLRERIDTWVSVCRPRIKATIAELQHEEA